MAYRDRDWEIVDYQMYTLKGTQISLRGPEPQNLKKNEYFVCLGAAQTFGVLCQSPYPTLLEQKLNIPVLNLGIGGAGPSFFLKENSLIEYINNSRFAIVQVMSGRSEDNSLFHGNGIGVFERLSDRKRVLARAAYKELIMMHDENYVKQIIAETRKNWIKSYQKLLELIKVPKILFWFSKRSVDYQEEYTKNKNIDKLLGEFPHLVNIEMMNKIKEYSDEYVECISRRGMPQLLISRFTGKPTTINFGRFRPELGSKEQTHNGYYPSLEMHIDAANILEPVCQSLMSEEQIKLTKEKNASNNIHTWQAAAKSHEAKKEFDQVVECYQSIIKLQPGNISTHTSLAETFVKQGKVDDAIASYHKVLEIAPGNSHACRRLGDFYQYRKGNLEEAIAYYEKAINRNTQNFWAYRNLGDALSKQGKQEAAIAALQEAINLQPDNPAVYPLLGKCQAQVGDIDGAIASWQKAIELNPQQPDWVRQSLSSLSKAIKK